MNTHKEFFLWRHDREAELNANSRIADTKKGPVEYAVKGAANKPALVFIHGGPGGYDQAFPYLAYMPEEDFSMITWSRPGYLRTPLTVGKSVREQADALAALLDFLNIKSVALNAFSAGGPIALAFAIHYPERVWALILESAVTMRYTPETEIQRFLFHFFLNDPVTWLTNLLAEYAPASVIKRFIDMESDFNDKQIEQILQNILNDNRKEQVIMGLIQSISPFSLRKKGLENDLDQLAQFETLPLEKIAAPVLILHGRHDAEVSAGHPENARRKIQNTDIYWVPDGMHELSLSDHIYEIKDRKLTFLNLHRPHSQGQLPEIPD